MSAREAGELRRRVRADHGAGALVAHGVHVHAARERLERRGVAPGVRHPVLVLGGLGPARGGHELERRVALAERAVGVGHLGDRAAVGLQAGGGQPLAVAVRRAAQQERVERLVGQRPEVMALPVAAQGVTLERVVHPLELQVGERLDPFADRAAERAQRREEPRVELGLAGPDEADAGHRPAAPFRRQGRRLRLAHPGGEGGRARRRRVQVAPAAQHRRRLLDRVEELDDVGPAGDRLQPELELGHHAEVAAAAAQSPEQLRVAGLVDAEPLALGGDQLVRRHVVARQPDPAREPAHAAAERQPADAGMRHVARGRGQPVLHRGAIERSEQGAALDAGAPARGIHPDPGHRRQVDHHPVVGDAHPEHAVTAAAHAELEVALAAVPDRLGHVARARAPHDRARPPVDHRVPHRPGLVVARVAVRQEPSIRRSRHRPDSPDRGRPAPWGSPPRRRYGAPHLRRRRPSAGAWPGRGPRAPSRRQP